MRSYGSGSAALTSGFLEGTRVEVEYTIVDRESLGVRPIADRLLGSEGRLALHALEARHTPVLHALAVTAQRTGASLAGAAAELQKAVVELDERLAAHGAMLLPGGMHPFMDPARETRLWPQADPAAAAALERVFEVGSHGFANSRCTRISLPFRGDAELGRLHAAVRVVLPLLPALAASSPLAEGRATGFLDARIERSRASSARVPSLAGALVPESLEQGTQAEYEREILAPIRAELAPHDPERRLHAESLNARGAIARFERGAIEIGLADAAECPAADVAIAEAVCAVVQALYHEELSSYADQRRLGTPPLANLLRDVSRSAERTPVPDAALLRVLGFPGRGSHPPSAREVWQHLIEATLGDSAEQLLTRARLDVILREGPLARRILAAGAKATSRDVYVRLASCLTGGRAFRLNY